MFSKLFQGFKKPILPTPAPATTPAEQTALQLQKLVQSTDVDALVSNTVCSMLYLTVYTTSVRSLFDELVTPHQRRDLVAVSLGKYFEDSHLSASVVLERIVQHALTQRVSTYAQHDINTLTQELSLLSAPFRHP